MLIGLSYEIIKKKEQHQKCVSCTLFVNRFSNSLGERNYYFFWQIFISALTNLSALFLFSISNRAGIFDFETWYQQLASGYVLGDTDATPPPLPSSGGWKWKKDLWPFNLWGSYLHLFSTKYKKLHEVWKEFLKGVNLGPCATSLLDSFRS